MGKNSSCDHRILRVRPGNEFETNMSTVPRIRPRAAICATSTEPNLCKAYRIQFACENKGKYFRSSKRRIQWLFGLTNLAAVRQGEKGEACRGEEHRVELVWSLTSGKTRIFWNRQDISNFFHEKSFEKVDLQWTTRSGEKLRILSHAEPQGPGVRQYDIFVDGVSFFNLPFIKDLGLNQEKVEMVNYEERSDEERIYPSGSFSDLTGEGPFLDPGLSHDNQGFRLSMVGLSPMHGDELNVVDELHSDLYSPILESLRQQITWCLPQTEEMVSRAIINAFFANSNGSQHSQENSPMPLLSSDSRESSGIYDISEPDPYQIEANAICEALQWFSHNAESLPLVDAEELALKYMQKMINDIFFRIRNDELSSDAASRILLHVGVALGLTFANPIPNQDTMIVFGLPSNCTAETLCDSLEKHGDVEATAVVKGTDFGFCRFACSSCASKVQADAQNKHIVIDGIILQNTFVLLESLRDNSDGNRRCIPSPAMSSTTQSDELREGTAFDEKVDFETTQCLLQTSTCIPHLLSPCRLDWEVCKAGPATESTDRDYYGRNSSHQYVSVHNKNSAKFGTSPSSVSTDHFSTTPAPRHRVD